MTDPGIDLNSTYQDGASVDWVTVSIKGSGSVEVCLTLDGSTCHGQIRSVGLEATTQKVIGTGTRLDTWGENLWTYDITAQRNKLFGVMLRSAQPGGAVSIQYASLSLDLSEVAGMPTSGSFRTCSPVKSNGGFHCSYIGAAGAGPNNIYWIHPDTGEASPAYLRQVAQAHEGMAGVYGAVLVEGMVRKGDAVELLD